MNFIPSKIVDKSRGRGLKTNEYTAIITSRVNIPICIKCLYFNMAFLLLTRDISQCQCIQNFELAELFSREK